MKRNPYKRLSYILIMVLLFSLLLPMLIYPKEVYADGTVVYNESEKRFEYNINVKASTTDNNYNTTGFTIEYNGTTEIPFSNQGIGWDVVDNPVGDRRDVTFTYDETTVRSVLKSHDDNINFTEDITIYFNAILKINNDGKQNYAYNWNDARALVSTPNLDWGPSLKEDIRKHYKIEAELPAQRMDILTVYHKSIGSNKIDEKIEIDTSTKDQNNNIEVTEKSSEYDDFSYKYHDVYENGSKLARLESGKTVINIQDIGNEYEVYFYYEEDAPPPEGNVVAQLKLSVNPNEITEGTTEDVVVTLDAEGSTSPSGVDKYFFEVGKTADLRNAVTFETTSDKWSITFYDVAPDETIYGRVTAYDEELDEDDDATDNVTIGEAELLNGSVRYNMWENVGSEGNFVKGTKLGTGKLDITDWKKGDVKYFEYPREVPRSKDSNSEYDYRSFTSKWDQLEKYYTTDEYILKGDDNGDMNEKITEKDFGDVIDIYYTTKDSNVNLTVTTLLQDKDGRTKLTDSQTVKLDVGDQYYYLDIEDVDRYINIYRSNFTYNQTVTNEYEKNVRYPCYDDFVTRSGYVIYQGDDYYHVANQYSVSTKVVEEDTYDHDPDTYEIFYAAANTDINVTMLFQEKDDVALDELRIGVSGPDENGKKVYTEEDGMKFYVPIDRSKADISLSDVFFEANKKRFDKRRIELEDDTGDLIHSNSYWKKEPSGWTNNYTGQEAVQLRPGEYEVLLEGIKDYDDYKDGHLDELKTDKLEFEVVDTPADVTAEMTIVDLYKELADCKDGKVTKLTETFKTGSHAAATNVFSRSDIYSDYKGKLGTYIGYSDGDKYIDSRSDLEDDLRRGVGLEHDRTVFPTYRIEKNDYLNGETKQGFYMYYFAYRVKYHYMNDETGKEIKEDEVKIFPSEFTIKLDEDYDIMDDIITSEFKADDIKYLGYSMKKDKSSFREYPRNDELTIELDIYDGEYDEDIYLWFNTNDADLKISPEIDLTVITKVVKKGENVEFETEFTENSYELTNKRWEIETEGNQVLQGSGDISEESISIVDRTGDFTAIQYADYMDEDEIKTIKDEDTFKVKEEGGGEITPPDPIGGNGSIVFVPNTSFEIDGNREGWVKNDIIVNVSISGDKTAERSDTAPRAYTYEEEKQVEDGTDKDGNPKYKTVKETKNDIASCTFTETWEVGTISVTGSATGTVSGMNGGNVTISTEGDSLQLSATLNEWVSKQKVWGSDSAPNGGSWTDNGTPSGNTTPPALYTGTSGIYKLDKIIPNSGTNISSRDWTNVAYNVVVTATDNLSGFWNSTSYYNITDRSHYSRNQGNQYFTKASTNETKTINVNQNGVYSVHVGLEDIAKNIMSNRTYGEFKFDNIPPYVAKFDIVGCNDVKERNIPKIGNGYQYMTDYDNKIRVTIGDELSGLIDTKFLITKSSTFPSESSMKNLNEGTGEAIAAPINKTFYINLNCGATKESVAATEFADLKEGLWYVHIYQRDRAGNITKTTSPPIFINKIRDLRVTGVADYNWKKYFLDENNNPTNLTKTGIPIRDMPVYKTKEENAIKLGYKVYFKIDTIGFDEGNDTIKIKPRFWAIDENNKIKEVRLYVEDDNSGDYKLIENSGYNPLAYDITLNSSHRNKREGTKDEEKSHIWQFDYYLPPWTKAVPIGQELDLVNENYEKQNLLIIFEIIGDKTYGSKFLYTEMDDTWGRINENKSFKGVEKEATEYGRKRSTYLDLLYLNDNDKINHGEVFWYNLYESAIDDLKLYREW